MIDENTAQTTNIPIPMFKSNLIETKVIASIPHIKLKTGNKTDIIMEYANGGTLASVIEKKQQTGSFYTNDELIGLFRQLATGMSQVNACLVHRDVKPDNILLCDDTFKISDFGLSKIAAEGTRTLSFKGAGTPLYMAPEAWDLSKNTIQMDIYSMGIVFYEVATFRRPYAQSPSTVDECKDMHLYSPIINPSKVNPALSPSLVSLINRMLEKSSKRRFETWTDVFNLLDAQSSPVSAIDKMVATAVAAKNAEDVARQQREAELKRQTKEREDHLKLVYSQYEQTILAPVIEFAEKINLQYAGKDKLTFPENQYVSRGQSKFFWKLNVQTPFVKGENQKRRGQSFASGYPRRCCLFISAMRSDSHQSASV